MAAIIKQRIVNVVMFFTQWGQASSCTLHYGCDTDLTPDSPDKFQTAWQAVVLSKWQDAVAAAVTFERIYTYSIQKELTRPGNDNLNNKLGSLSDQALPTNLAAVFQLRQDDVNSKNNGRIFVGGITEVQCVDGLITVAAIGAELKDLADALLTTVTDSDGRNYKLVALQKSSGGSPITPIGHTVSVITISRSPATIGRRKTHMQSYST